MHDDADIGGDGDGLHFGDGMGEFDHLDGERPDFDRAADFYFDDFGFSAGAHFGQLVMQESGGERRCVNRATEFAPDIGDCA